MTEDTRKYASAQQLWRLNTLGLIRLVDWPDEAAEPPLERTEAKEILSATADAGLWQSATRGERGEHRWDSVNS
jgi:hypothetical protein